MWGVMRMSMAPHLAISPGGAKNPFIYIESAPSGRSPESFTALVMAKIFCLGQENVTHQPVDCLIHRDFTIQIPYSNRVFSWKGLLNRAHRRTRLNGFLDGVGLFAFKVKRFGRYVLIAVPDSGLHQKDSFSTIERR